MDPFECLRDLGADRLPHVHAELTAHLRGTHDLLARWGSRPALCLAGLYHSVYGTEGYGASLPVSREQIQAIIGTEAESLVYLFHACDRAFVYREILERPKPRFRDRIDGSIRPLDDATLADLCELTVANELEIILASPRGRRQQALRFRPLFEKMRPHLSAAAVQEYRRLVSS